MKLIDKLLGVVEPLFGHAHNAGIVFTKHGQSYRRCLDCGMKRDFDMRRMRFTSSWYIDPPEVSEYATLLANDLYSEETLVLRLDERLEEQL